MTLRDYLAKHRGVEFEARRWDCSKFALLWIATFAPKAAKAGVKLLVDSGYNDVAVGDDDGLGRLYAPLGIKTPDELAAYCQRHLPVDLPGMTEPGDIAIRRDLSFGIIDYDYYALYLGKPKGYVRKGLELDEAFIRVREE